ncbi:peptidoglycan-binding protein [Plantactinospora solaniradicis]|uniref:Peptidoglycan-binding protein n=1 Tax=Plantactinospora solaniradicis TaxID=1723736 RepID=A0ABW1K5A0_9ACTN
MSRTRMMVLTGVALVGVVGAAGFIVINNRADSTGVSPVTSVSTGTADVRRMDIAERQTVTGTLGHRGTYTIIAPGPGVLTRMPAVGQVVSRGGTAYEVDGEPVVLMYGGRPSWRTLELGMTNGADVRQLETNLKELGHGDGLTVDTRFSLATYSAVRRWQRAANLAVTGDVPLGQIVFMPAAVRIGSHDLQVGTQVQPGATVAHGTSNEPAVTIQLSPQQLPSAKVGDSVRVTLPDGKTQAGAITNIGAVTTAAGGSEDSTGTESESTVPVTVKVNGAVTGFLDQAQVQVAITVELHPKVLAVPITALNALPGGGYEVILVEGSATRRVPVETGLFDEAIGMAEVSGPGLAEGQKVQVPSDDA